MDREVRTKKKILSQPIVDANHDVSKLLLTLMFVLDGVGKQELDAYNRRQVQLPVVFSLQKVCTISAYCVHINECASSVLM